MASLRLWIASDGDVGSVVDTIMELTEGLDVRFDETGRRTPDERSVEVEFTGPVTHLAAIATRHVRASNKLRDLLNELESSWSSEPGGDPGSFTWATSSDESP